MGEMDVVEKILESYNDVFANTVNVLLFNGESVIKPDELVDQAPRAAYKADGRIREIERDVAKRWLKINLFEIAYLTREQVNLFKSDFRIVADYFVQKQENGDYIPGPEKLHHVQETLQLLSVMTNDHRFEEAYSDNPEEGEVQNMCDVLDRAERRGAEKKAREAAINLYKMGMAAEDIAKVLNEALSTVQQWLGIASA